MWATLVQRNASETPLDPFYRPRFRLMCRDVPRPRETKIPRRKGAKLTQGKPLLSETRIPGSTQRQLIRTVIVNGPSFCRVQLYRKWTEFGPTGEVGGWKRCCSLKVSELSYPSKSVFGLPTRHFPSPRNFSLTRLGDIASCFRNWNPYTLTRKKDRGSSRSLIFCFYYVDSPSLFYYKFSQSLQVPPAQNN